MDSYLLNKNLNIYWVFKALVFICIALFSATNIYPVTMSYPTILDAYDEGHDVILIGELIEFKLQSEAATVVVKEVINGNIGFSKKINLTLSEKAKKYFYPFMSDYSDYFRKINVSSNTYLIFANYDKNTKTYVINNISGYLGLERTGKEFYIPFAKMSVSEFLDLVRVRSKILELVKKSNENSDEAILFDYMLSDEFLESKHAASNFFQYDSRTWNLDGELRLKLEMILFYEILSRDLQVSEDLSNFLLYRAPYSLSTSFLIKKYEENPNSKKYRERINELYIWTRYGRPVNMDIVEIKRMYKLTRKNVIKADSIKMLEFFESDNEIVRKYAAAIMYYINSEKTDVQ